MGNGEVNQALQIEEQGLNAAYTPLSIAFPLEGKVAAVRRTDEVQRTPFAFP